MSPVRASALYTFIRPAPPLRGNSVSYNTTKSRANKIKKSRLPTTQASAHAYEYKRLPFLGTNRRSRRAGGRGAAESAPSILGEGRRGQVEDDAGVARLRSQRRRLIAQRARKYPAK
jgi:hypothetical protein